jgi:two-component system, OmpR family, response regulator
MENVPTISPSVLLVEDDDEVRKIITQRLMATGYQVIVSTNEADAVETLGHAKADIELILVDQNMSSDQALAVGRRIRDHFDLNEGVPIVVIPLEFKEELEDTDEEMGGRDYKTYFTTNRQLDNLLKKLLS